MKSWRGSRFLPWGLPKVGNYSKINSQTETLQWERQREVQVSTLLLQEHEEPKAAPADSQETLIATNRLSYQRWWCMQRRRPLLKQQPLKSRRRLSLLGEACRNNKDTFGLDENTSPSWAEKTREVEEGGVGVSTAQPSIFNNNINRQRQSCQDVVVQWWSPHRKNLLVRRLYFLPMSVQVLPRVIWFPTTSPKTCR